MTAMNQALTLRTKLLVAEYGRERVIAALARVEDVEFETIEREVEAVKEKKVRRHRRPKTLSELLKEANINPEKFSLVEKITCAYGNKQYLPELWRVKRFLESNGVDGSNVRTRTAGLPLVVRVLGGLSEGKLNEMLDGLNMPTKGDLKIIADQILGPPRKQSQTVVSADRESDEWE